MTEFDALRDGIDPTVTAGVVPIKYGSGVMRNRGRSHTAGVVGSTSAYLHVTSIDTVAGTPFSDEQYRDAARVVLIGPALVDSLFSGNVSAALDSNVVIGRHTFRVIGILGPDGKGMSSGTTALVPLTSAREYLFGERRRDLSALALLPAAPEHIIPTVRQAEEILDRLHQVKSVDQRDFTVSYISVLPPLIEIFEALIWALVLTIGAILLVIACGLIKMRLAGSPHRGWGPVTCGHRVQPPSRTSIVSRLFFESTIASAFSGILGVTIGTAILVIQQQTLPTISPTYPIPQISVAAIILAFSAALLIGFPVAACDIFHFYLKSGSREESTSYAAGVGEHENPRSPRPSPGRVPGR